MVEHDRARMDVPNLSLDYCRGDEHQCQIELQVELSVRIDVGQDTVRNHGIDCHDCDETPEVQWNLHLWCPGSWYAP